MSKEIATVSKATALATYLDTRKSDFASVSVIDTDKFMRVVKNALMKDPKIAEASTQSVFIECQKAIADGLVLDGREAALTRYNTKDGVQVVYIPMVAGIMKRVRNSGEILSWSVELVYEREYEEGKFVYHAAPDPMIRHEPIIIGDRGPVVAAYSAVKLRDGGHHYEVMTKDQLDRIRKRSRAQNGPWSTDTEEMYRKTVIRRHAKRLPVASEILDVTSRVDSLYDPAEEEISSAAEPAPVVKSRKTSAARKLKEAAAVIVDPDVLEGEIMDDETGEFTQAEPDDINPEDEF